MDAGLDATGEGGWRRSSMMPMHMAALGSHVPLSFRCACAFHLRDGAMLACPLALCQHSTPMVLDSKTSRPRTFRFSRCLFVVNAGLRCCWPVLDAHDGQGRVVPPVLSAVHLSNFLSRHLPCSQLLDLANASPASRPTPPSPRRPSPSSRRFSSPSTSRPKSPSPPSSSAPT